MKRFILAFLLIMSALFAELKEDDIRAVENNSWGAYLSQDEFDSSIDVFYLANWESHDYEMESYSQSIQIFRNGTGYYDTFIILQLDYSMLGEDSDGFTVRFKIGNKVYNKEATTKNIGTRLTLRFSDDIYKMLIDNMCAGQPLRIIVEKISTGNTTLLYADNTGFKSKYEGVQKEYSKIYK